MAWTWAGFWRDDPVFRYKDEDFFQSGRHKAEERFWKNYIHDTGGYGRPLYRLRKVTEKDEKEDDVENAVETGCQNKEKAEDKPEENNDAESLVMEDDEDWEKIQEYEWKRQELEQLLVSLKKRGWKRTENKEDEEEILSTYTCSSCSRCFKPKVTRSAPTSPARKPASSDRCDPPSSPKRKEKLTDSAQERWSSRVV